ncbi:response regulator transcription factor [Pseudoalteromonas sp. T1lg88]|uniref:response regulator transcription factor n=1 Tax=Pseudoalteromonas sp. T1lg88 TaxID=2077104 RepID=UPI000CF66DF3|nr:response regulator [Pseudoalteromonas sp. T1lg88]
MAAMHKLLLIEDDLRLGEGIKRLLSDQGYFVEHFCEAGGVEKQLRTQAFDAIICDVMLPGIDGFQLMARLRHLHSAKIIFLSALTDTEHQLQGYELGAADYITKPVGAGFIVGQIKSHLTV